MEALLKALNSLGCRGNRRSDKMLSNWFCWRSQKPRTSGLRFEDQRSIQRDKDYKRSTLP
jgi:hypothetical protein